MAPTFYYVLSYLFKKTKTPSPHQEAYFFPVDHDDLTVFWCQVRLGGEDNITTKLVIKKILSNFIMNKRYKDSR